jgi:hypothetical protein
VISWNPWTVVTADGKECDASSRLFAPLQVPRGLALSDFEKAKALADSLEVQLQPVNDPSVLVLIDTVNEAMLAYYYAPAREPKLTSLSEATKGLIVGMAPGPNVVPNRVLTNQPKSAKTFITKVIYAVFRRQYLPTTMETRSRGIYTERTLRCLLSRDS